MNFTTAITTCFHKYVDFTARAIRSEYWYWVLFNVLAQIVATIVDVIIFGHSSIFLAIVTLGLVLPSLAVAVRRLHDTDRSGWWILIALVPLVGAIILIVFMCQRGTVGPNRFGPEPA
jgi:uncharacterized membrane protein YhaH (DUF805 family)